MKDVQPPQQLRQNKATTRQVGLPPYQYEVVKRMWVSKGTRVHGGEIATIALEGNLATSSKAERQIPFHPAIATPSGYTPQENLCAEARRPCVRTSLQQRSEN